MDSKSDSVSTVPAAAAVHEDTQSDPSTTDMASSQSATPPKLVTEDQNDCINADLDVVPPDITAAETVLPSTLTSPQPGAGLAWGSFIKRAVSTVEQRLDMVLDPALANDGTKLTPSVPATDRSGQRISMQERLALAMKQNNPGARKQTPGSTPAPSSVGSNSPRASLDVSARPSIEESGRTSIDQPEQVKVVSTPAPVVLVDETVPEAEVEQETTELQTITSATAAVDQSDSLRAELAQKQEELSSSVNRVTILEEKIKYLSNELLDYTQKRTQTNIDKKLAEKDEKIALLLLEGETLSKQELKHMTTIKRLRAAEREGERIVQDAKKRQEKAEKEAIELREKLRKASEIERKQSERIRILAKSESEVDILKREQDLLKSTITDLRNDLAKANLVADEAVQRAQSELLEKERKRANDLEQQLESLKAEQAMDKEKYTHETYNLESKLSRESDRSKARERELREEIASLEHKLEMLRAQTEELTAGATGGQHAKMLRQIETLQSQYALATENWQGIEASLLSRIAGIEHERDEIAKREAVLRKKLHDETARVRDLEIDVENALSKTGDLESELQLQEDLVTSLRSRLEDETARSAVKIQELEKDKASLEQRLLEEEKARRDDVQLQLRSGASSPTFSKRGYGSDMGMMSPGFNLNGQSNGLRIYSRDNSYSELHSPSQTSINSLNATGAPTAIQYRRASRRKSGRISTTPSISGTSALSIPVSPVFQSSTPTRTISFSSLNGSEGGGGSVHQQINLQHAMLSREDSMNGSKSDSNGGDDAGSAASTAMGDVSSSERLTTVIRRLSSELASAKEELTLLVRDRDQARAEIVELMRDAKAKSDVETECAELKAQVEQLQLREQTTLELLGEKTERVNELADDVQDMKMMYRQQIQELVEQLQAKEGS
ncbi:TATA element modulatory factor 1 TATA binding-domain-containing protein [Lipomyces arxii]|uniref:TATA element modulatory factor 1 TATA binding-domain-containing protein n=1 Tax=Lipomyces arxii TaxID=56418 RepID=UPI0034CD2AB2